MEPVLRPMSLTDQAMVMVIQADAYEPQFHEKWEVLLDKLRLYPAGCWICTIGNETAGYLFSHPSLFDSPPALNIDLETLPDRPDCYYIHDLAIRKSHQRCGIGRIFCSKALELARDVGFPQMALIAVAGSGAFWSTQDFRQAEVSAEIANKLRTYGESAIYMRRNILENLE